MISDLDVIVWIYCFQFVAHIHQIVKMHCLLVIISIHYSWISGFQFSRFVTDIVIYFKVLLLQVYNLN